ncbi:MAG: pyruvate kinase [Lachnospiraceae bacterium]
MRRTKVICTLGPAVDNDDMIRALIRGGMNIARFNFSHGTHEEHRERLARLRRISEEEGVPVAAMLDTKGPEIRTCDLEGGKKVTLEDGQDFILTTRNVIGDNTIVGVTYGGLSEDLKEGDTILIDDGLIELKVLRIKGTDIICRVINGGELGQKKGVNLPGISVNLPAITEKDKDDIIFGCQEGFDFIAASFVRNVDAVLEIKEILQEYGHSSIKVISKIENREGVNNVDSIIKAGDGIMIARGDLGVEIPPEEVPYLQKMMIKKANDQFKFVITATQMLDSMMRNPRPTRAEVGDVANAVYDCTDVVMLSGETAAGKYPIESLKMMCKICEEAESHLDFNEIIASKKSYVTRGISTAVIHAAAETALTTKAKYIVTPSLRGYTCRLISKFRPVCPVIGMSPDIENLRQMQIMWGVIPFQSALLDTVERTDVIDNAYSLLKKSGMLKSGDTIIITAGAVPNGSNVITSVTNTMQVLTER